VEEHESQTLVLTLKFEDAAVAGRVATVLEANGAQVSADGATLEVTGQGRDLFKACLADAEAGYHNRGDELAARYGFEGRAVLHAWWAALGAAEKDLNRQKLFDAAHLVHAIQTKAVECSYNYYGIDPGRIRDRWGTVLFSLVFYVVYTIWYGYAIMFLFEGLGLRLAH
jgi:hypothetical protein